MHRRTAHTVVVTALAGGIFVPSLGAQQTPPGPPAGVPGAAVVNAVRHDTSRPLRDIPPIVGERGGDREVHAPFPVKRPPTAGPPQRDPVLQESFPASSVPLTTVNFDGVNNVDGVLPPDVNGDVGPNHYLQWVNLSFAIYSKSGAVLYGPADGNTLFDGFGGPCETTNNGDPIVLYDEHANRWLVSQFALPNTRFNLRGPFYQCIAISKTADPTGEWHRYEFKISDTKLNDYPKFGVWPDGYYMAVNQFNEGSGSWAGQGVVVFERDRMLNGQSARMVYFDMVSDTSLGGMLPSDLDGPLPPSGAPNYFMQFDDQPDRLQVWAFATNWNNPTTSSFTRVTNLSTAALDSNMCGYSRSCVPQAGTSARLDAISDRLMYRLQYRNFGSHQSWVVNHTVDVNGADHAGIRWYEIRKAGSGLPSIHQQGTFSPDATHRWMASAAMDAAGNIALAYNTSSGTSYPSIRYTARLASDTDGEMTLGEGDLMVGSGAQTHSASRWGDYSMLAVDPSDGCTFWATLEYVQSTGSAPWRTRIAAFKLPGCGSTVSPPAAPTDLGAVAASATQIDLSWTDNATTESGFRIERCQGSGCSDFAEIGTVGANVTTFADDSGLLPETDYRYRVRAYNTGGNSDYSNTAPATTQPGTTGGSAPAAPTSLIATNNKTSVSLSWTDNATNETYYEVWRAVNAGAPSLLTTLGPDATSHLDNGVGKRKTYTYFVQACNAAGCTPSGTASVKR